MDKTPIHRARKRFGQNFLHDQNVISRIIQALNPLPTDRIVEIGPGQGALTYPLLDEIGRLEAIELDRDLIAELQRKSKTHGELVLHSADALKFDFTQLAEDKPLRLIGNLPYNISTPLLFHLIRQTHCISDMHFMLQKEVVDRMGAPPGSKDYGRLSVMIQYHCQVIPLFTVSPGSFKPAPKVQSAIVRLIPHKIPPVQVSDLGVFQKVVKQAFSQRRKMLRKTLGNWLSETQIEELGIEPSVRPERLSLEQFACLSNKIVELTEDSGTLSTQRPEL